METAISRYTVDFDEDYIKIIKDNKYEVLYWTQEEWEKEPDLVFTIANAVYLSQRNPSELEKLGVMHEVEL